MFAHDLRFEESSLRETSVRMSSACNWTVTLLYSTDTLKLVSCTSRRILKRDSRTGPSYVPELIISEPRNRILHSVILCTNQLKNTAAEILLYDYFVIGMVTAKNSQFSMVTLFQPPTLVNIASVLKVGPSAVGATCRIQDYG